MSKIEVYDWDGITNVKEERVVLVEKWLYRGDIMMLKAQKKEGKSVLAQEFAFALSSGCSFLDTFEVDCPHKVAYISGEGFLGDWKDRFLNMEKVRPVGRDNIRFFNTVKLGLNTDAGGEKLIKELRATKVPFSVFIYDPLYRFLSNGSYSDDKDMNMFFNNVEMVQNEFKSTSIIVHHDSEKFHHTKNGSFSAASGNTGMGASVIGMAITHWYTITNYTDKKKRKIRKIKLGTSRSGDLIEELDVFMVIPEEDKEGRLFMTLDHNDLSSHYQTLKAFIHHHGKISDHKTYLHEDLEMAESTFYLQMKKLREQGLVKKITEKNKKGYYIWNEKPL